MSSSKTGRGANQSVNVLVKLGGLNQTTMEREADIDTYMERHPPPD